MRAPRSSPFRAIGDVVADLQRTYPDVSHSSLRFLEREGFISPTRTPGGHRLYSTTDVERVRQIKHWQAQRYSLDEIRSRLRQRSDQPASAELAARFLELILAGQSDEARALLIAADDAGQPLVDLFAEVLEPALREVGTRWALGSLLVVQEKEVSELARELIAELSRRHATALADAPVILAAAVEGERHDLGLRMLCALLRARGLRVFLLGADVAPRFLLEATRLHAPDLILLSATLEPNVVAIRDAVAVLRAELGEACPVVAVGGNAALNHPELVGNWGVRLIGSDRLATAADAVFDLVGTSRLAAAN